MGRRIIPVNAKACLHCNLPMERKRWGARLEDRAVYARRKYCDPRCMGLAHRKPDPSRDAYRKRAYPMRKDRCESCGVAERLSIHHDNRNWRDNSPDNIKTLCTSCHTSLHHARGDIHPIRSSLGWTDCDVSETPSCQHRPSTPLSCSQEGS